jgi:HEAT repeat protein
MDAAAPDVKSLVGALTSEDRVRRTKARSRLKMYGYPEAVEAVLELVYADEYDVVDAAADILTGYDRRDLIATLIKVAATWEFRRDPMGNPVLFKLHRFEFDSLSLLNDALQSDDEGLRAAAATCAPALRDARALPALHAALSDPSLKVRSAAAKALERLKREGN